MKHLAPLLLLLVILITCLSAILHEFTPYTDSSGRFHLSFHAQRKTAQFLRGNNCQVSWTIPAGKRIDPLSSTPRFIYAPRIDAYTCPDSKGVIYLAETDMQP